MHFAPQLTTIMLTDDGEVNATQATSFAYLLLPQIFFYGLFALSKRYSIPRMFWTWCLGTGGQQHHLHRVLVAYQVVPGSLHSEAPSPVSDPHVLLLALGTTLGVIVQCLILFPYLKKAGINLKPLWGLDDRLKQFGGMAMAIVAYVAVSQLGYIITSRIASQADEGAPLLTSRHGCCCRFHMALLASRCSPQSCHACPAMQRTVTSRQSYAISP